MEKNEQRPIPKLFLLVLLGAFILLFKLFWTYMSAIILALLIASAFSPLYHWMKKSFRDNETAAALFMTFLILFILLIPVGGFVGTLSNEAFDFYRRANYSVSLQKIQRVLENDPIWAQRVKKVERLTGVQINPQALDQLARAVGKNVGLFLSRQLQSIASNLLSFLIHFFLMMLIIYYLFRDGARLRNYLSELLPFPASQQELIVNKFREMGKAVIVGNGLSGIIQGILGGFGFFIFGIGSPFLWGTVIGVMAFLPIIGASIVFLPATAILFIQGRIGLAIGYLIYNASYSLAMEYFVKPRLIGKGMKMNPLLVFIGVLGGIKLFGILGVIYGPLIMTIFLTLAEIYRMEYRETMA